MRKILLQRALLTYSHSSDDSFNQNESVISEEISGDPCEIVIWEEPAEKLPWEG